MERIEMPPSKFRSVYVAKETMVVEYDGHPVTIIAGKTRIREGHKIMKGREVFFEPLTDEVDFEVETATAAPAEERGSNKPAATKAEEKPAQKAADKK
jgi:hypothetical protein